jgi:hypothetical protein
LSTPFLSPMMMVLARSLIGRSVGGISLSSGGETPVAFGGDEADGRLECSLLRRQSLNEVTLFQRGGLARCRLGKYCTTLSAFGEPYT